MTAAATLTITSEPESLPTMRAWLREALAHHGVRPEAIAGLVVAAGELCTNAIKHAYAGRPGEPIHLSVTSVPAGVVVEIEDFGRPFDPARYREPDLDELAESGLGIHLVRSLTDEASFDIARPRGTRWTLVSRRG